MGEQLFSEPLFWHKPPDAAQAPFTYVGHEQVGKVREVYSTTQR